MNIYMVGFTSIVICMHTYNIYKYTLIVFRYYYIEFVVLLWSLYMRIPPALLVVTNEMGEWNLY